MCKSPHREIRNMKKHGNTTPPNFHSSLIVESKNTEMVEILDNKIKSLVTKVMK
jgi:hypothetical protein